MSASRSAVPVSHLPPAARSSLKRGESVPVTSRGETIATIQPSAPTSAQARLLALAGSIKVSGRLDPDRVDELIAEGIRG